MDVSTEQNGAGRGFFGRAVPALFWALSVVVAVVLTAANLFLGDLNQDEGWYLYGARLVSEGRWPYIDFATTQGPVFSFVYAAAQPMVKLWGVAGGRLFSALLGWGCAVCAALLAASLAGGVQRRLAAFFAFTLLAVNVFQSFYFATVKTYSLAAIFLLAGFLVLCRAMKSQSRWAAAGAGGLLCLAAGTRISSAVAIPVVCGCLLVEAWRRKSVRCEGSSGNPGGLWVWTAAGAAVVGAIVFLPFLLLAPQAFWFGVVEYHTARDPGGWLPLLAYKAGFVSRVVQDYFVALALGVGALVYRGAVRWGWLACGPRNSEQAGASGRGSGVGLSGVFVTAGMISLVHFLAPFPYDDYQVIVYPLFCVGLAVVLAQETVHAGARAGTALAGLVLFLCAASAFSSPTNQEWFIGKRDRIWWPLKKVSSLGKLQETAGWIRTMTRPGDTLLTQDAYLAVETGLRLPEGLELGQFSYYPDWETERAKACHVVNRAMFKELLGTCEAPVAAFSGYGLAIRSPEVTPLSEAEALELWDIVEKRYVLERVVEDFGQALTPLRVLLRKRVE